MRRYLGLGDEQEQVDQTPLERAIPLLVVSVILLVTYNVLERPWWQEMLIATAGIFVAGMVVGLWQRKADREAEDGLIDQAHLDWADEVLDRQGVERDR